MKNFYTRSKKDTLEFKFVLFISECPEVSKQRFAFFDIDLLMKYKSYFAYYIF